MRWRSWMPIRSGCCSSRGHPRRHGSVSAYSAIEPVLGVVAQFVEDQRIGLVAEAPVHHQHDDLQVVERHRAVAGGHGAVDHDLAHGGGSTPAPSRKLMKPRHAAPQLVLLGHRVHAQARGARVPCAGRRRRQMFCAATVRSIEPDQRVVDLVGLEAVGAELASELVELGASIAAPVVFVDEHQHFKHEPRYTQDQSMRRLRDAGAPRRCWLASPRAGARPGRPVQARAAPCASAGMPVRATNASRLHGSKPRASSSASSAFRLPRTRRGSRCRAASQHRAQVLQHVLRDSPPAWRPGAAARGSRARAASGSSRGWRTPPLFGGEARRDQRARLQRRLHHQRALARAEMSRLRAREVAGRGGVPIGYSLMIEPAPDALGRCAVDASG